MLYLLVQPGPGTRILEQVQRGRGGSITGLNPKTDGYGSQSDSLLYSMPKSVEHVIHVMLCCRQKQQTK